MKRKTLEAMLRCSEEWVEFWERRALAAEKALVAESYEISLPPSYPR
jgi:hypothetical protein